jgi:hypothetical protein
VRYVLCILCCILLCSCRDIQPYDRFIPIQGYQLNGTVTTPNGIPLDSVEVRLWYNYGLYRTTPLDTIQVVVTDSTKIVYIAVYTYDFSYVRKLFLGFSRPGVLPRFSWNEQDDNGNFVPSGKYIIRYVYNDTIRKDVPYIAAGHTTAMTDADGRFTLTNANLPIGEVADFYSNHGDYEGTFIVLHEIILDFIKGDARRRYRLTLERDKLIRGSFTLE